MREIIKELKVGIRSGRFLILSASFIFYGLLTPILLTVIMPEVLAKQFRGEDLESLLGMLDASQTAVMTSFLGDISEIGTLLVAFVLCGLIAQEVKENTLVLPLSSGSRYHQIIGAKALVYGSFLLVVSMLALLADYLYAGMLTSFEVDWTTVAAAGLLVGYYMFFLVVCVMMWGSLINKPIAAGFLTLATTFGMQFLAGLLQKGSWVPSGLLADATNFSGTVSDTLPLTLAVTAGMIVLMLYVTHVRLGRMEWNGR